MVAPAIIGALITGVVSLVGTPLVNFGLQELKSKLEGEHISLDDMHKVLSNGLEWLLALQRDKNWEVSSKTLEDKAATEVYRTWTKRVLKVEKEVISLNIKYENKKKSTWHLSDIDLKCDVKNALTEVLELVEKCPEKILANYKLPKRVIKEIRVPSVADYPTQRTPFDKILKLLLRSNSGIKCVALHGQIGVGKTTIMQNLNNHFENNNRDRFEMVIFIRVAAGDQTDECKEGLHILQEIARRIKVDEQGDESQVARRIQEVLKETIYLLILDGVRYQLALEGIWGSLDIPEHNIDSKVVITTHYPGALKANFEKREVSLQPLDPNEEWQMFRDIVGNNLSLDISNARILCKRFCFCLPILISPIASSFKHEEPHTDWQTALNKYTSWAEVDDLNKIYSNLRICYEQLKGESEKKCFLYASLYPANTKIYTRYFVECCKVQGILGDVDGTTRYTEMRGRAIHVTLRHLVNVALLEEGEQMRYVRMNDLYRGFALCLSKESNPECKIYVDNEKHEEPYRSDSWRNARWVSMVGSERDCLPSERNFGSLETLLLQKNLKLVQIPQDSFASMGNLLVLNLYGTKIRELPALSRLTRLKALYLNGCSDLRRDLSQIQLPGQLEVLDIRGIGVNFIPRLISLRCLRISYTLSGNYDRISELHNLEELTIDIKETKIRELLALSKLTCLKALYLNGHSNLQIDLSKIQLPEQLEVLDIRIGVNFVPHLICLRYLRILYTPSGNYDGISQLHNLEELAIDIEQQLEQQWNSHGNKKIAEATNSLKNLNIDMKIW